MTQTAVEIYQDFLDRCSKMFFGYDFEGRAAMMVYPHTMETLDGDLTYNTPEQMIEAGRDFRAYLEKMQTREYFRLCKTADFVPGRKDQIVGTHETYALRGNGYVVEPYRNAMSLELEDGIWKGAGISAQVSNVTVPILSPKQLRDRALADAQEQTKEPNR